jgi:pyruvate kinase
MLNKGAHIVDAVCFLDNVLQRMQFHQRKKRAMLRRLSVAEHFAGNGMPDAIVQRNLPYFLAGTR